jgi:hypothetical protein
MMDDILGLGRPRPDGNAARLKDLIRQRFGLAEETTVMVSELRCHEEGCPDVETVIAVMDSGQTTRSWKIAKPMAAVSAEDIGNLSVPS